MFSYVFMKILEMRPGAYDQRMDKVSRGRVRAVKVAVAGEVPEGSHVLEIGCGTGELASLIITRNCTVEGFDLNAAMVEVSKDRINEENLTGKFSVSQMGVDGMDNLPSAGFDAVVATLVFSELNDDERRFALKHAVRSLKPGGHLIIADEVIARTGGRRLAQNLIRLPLTAVTFLVSSSVTRPIKDLIGEMKAERLTIIKEERSHGDAFSVVAAIKKGETAG